VVAEQTLSRARAGDQAAFREPTLLPLPRSDSLHQIAADLNADGTATGRGGAQGAPMDL
jgi:hypothetical protein